MSAAGRDAEAKAEQHLRQQGLKPLTRNYRTRRGEIDLVMQHRDELVFVEVRQRRSRRYGGAAASISNRKQQRVIAAAQAYLQRHGSEQPCRFDVVAVEADGKPQWIPDAFQVE